MSKAIDTFFGKFGELTDNAEQIPYVRKFIVSALIHESLNAKRAIELADQIRSKHRDIAAGNAVAPSPRRNKLAHELTTEDLPPQLQDLPIPLFGRLDEITTIEKGLSPIQKTKPGPYPLVVTAEERGSSDKFDFIGPAVAIPMVSSTGHGDASLKRIHYQEGEFAAGNILAVVKPICPQIINARFLYEYLTSFKEELLVARMSGTANVSLTVNRLNEVPVPLVTGPALQKLDALMAQCDRLEAQLRERDSRQAELARAALARFAEAPTPANLHLLFHDSFTLTPADLRKTILTLAVQGELVPQDPKDEPAEKLLARAAEQKATLIAAGEIGQEKPSPAFDPDELPFDLPESWTWSRLSGLTELITKGSSPKWQGVSYVNSGETGVLFITSENVGNYTLRKLDDLKFVERRFNEIEPRSILHIGDILMNLVGASIGRTAIYDLEDVANINQAVALIRPVRNTESVLPGFLLHYFNSPTGIEHMLSSRVTSAQPNISLTDARNFPIPIPPLAEQRRIVAKVDHLMALVDEWEARLTATRTTATHLLDALVSELTAEA